MSEQRIAIVTGGASGIGLGICQRLASDGHLVAVLALEGNQFVTINNGKPFCGTLIRNSNVAP